jgi:hypothetical protein
MPYSRIPTVTVLMAMARAEFVMSMQTLSIVRQVQLRAYWPLYKIAIAMKFH